MGIEEKLKQIEKEAFSQIDQAGGIQELENLRIKYLGRKGIIANILKTMKEIPVEDRPGAGKLANRLKDQIHLHLQSKFDLFSRLKRQQKRRIDVSLPGISPPIGHSHPITQVIERINEIFIELGFRIVEGPEIETEYYNFQALNIPLEHPSRDVFDTFYIKDDILLRSHTSPVQIRAMETERPPLRIIIPGRVFRPDAVDASHSFMFHQVEGLMVDRRVTFSELKGTLSVFVRQMFGEGTRMRFRPHFFPFTEPSAEVDISCIICKGKGCRVCSHKGWLEILGAGMVDPQVFKNVGYDPEKFTGFAFGMGVERIAMLKFGINDIRLFFENDLRFLKQF